MKSCLLIFITATVAIVSANAEDCKGCVPLDTITFDKVSLCLTFVILILR